MGGLGRVSWLSSSSLRGGVFSSTQLEGFGQAEFGSSNFPFKRGWNVGDGRFCSSWPGRGSLADPLTAPHNSQGTGGGGGPHTNWALGLEACGEGLPRPSRPEGSLSSNSLRPALLFGAEAPELNEGRHSSQCSSVWLVFQDPSSPALGSKHLLCLLPGMFCCHLSLWN